MIILAVFSTILVLVYARPQEFERDAELVPPVENQGSVPTPSRGGEKPVVLVIRTAGLPGFSSGGLRGFSSGGPPSLSGGFNGGFGSFFNSGPSFVRNSPRVPSFFDEEDDLPELGGFGGFGGLGDVFGLRPRPQVAVKERVGNKTQTETSSANSDCGLLCLMFRVLTGIQSEVDVIHEDMHPAAGGRNKTLLGGKFDVNNSTYEEKVLGDGTKVRINRTVLSNTDGQGNGFFFHSSVVHNFNDDGGLSYEEESEEDAPSEGIPALVGQVESVEEQEKVEEEEKEDPLDSADPALNEIEPAGSNTPAPAASKATSANPSMAVDDGLKQNLVGVFSR